MIATESPTRVVSKPSRPRPLDKPASPKAPQGLATPQQLAAHVAGLLNRHHPLRDGEPPFLPRHVSIIYQGRYGNANVYRYTDASRDLIVKDFSRCVWWFRHVMGRRFVSKECGVIHFLKDLQGRGIVTDAHKLGPFTFCYTCIPGASVGAMSKAGRKLPAAFFQRWDQLVQAMHQRGIVHLDMRNTGNVLVGDDGCPTIIDFQSALRIRFLPRFIKNILKRVDRSAVIKGWIRHGDSPLPPEQAAWYENFLKTRNLWVSLTHPLRLLTTLFWRVVARFRRTN
ncbi:hypothetical protein [Geminisphaera colitermitum]|uniref:hypothetical protein n=1 Tax=Geminisphaera colitermitum TaxID=1148786 RepID=UPI000158D3E7|nr:hypothetical protein [Geminisphaera colitermitum]